MEPPLELKTGLNKQQLHSSVYASIMPEFSTICTNFQYKGTHYTISYIDNTFTLSHTIFGGGFVIENVNLRIQDDNLIYNNDASLVILLHQNDILFIKYALFEYTYFIVWDKKYLLQTKPNCQYSVEFIDDNCILRSDKLFLLNFRTKNLVL
jgi:hypothetical protein